MKVKVVVHQAEEGGYCGFLEAEVPAIPGCATQGESFEELLMNLYEAIEGCLAVEVDERPLSKEDRSNRNSGMKAVSGQAVPACAAIRPA